MRDANVGWVERSSTHHAFVAMGRGLKGHNPSYALVSFCDDKNLMLLSGT